MSGRLTTGASCQPSAYGANRTRADLPPLPARSILSERNPFISESDEKTAEGAVKTLLAIVVSLGFVVSFAAIGVMMHFR